MILTYTESSILTQPQPYPTLSYLKYVMKRRSLGLACGAVELLRAPELVCRAWDETMNTQPDTLTWNLMCALAPVVKACGLTCFYHTSKRLVYVDEWLIITREFAMLGSTSQCCAVLV